MGPHSRGLAVVELGVDVALHMMELLFASELLAPSAPAFASAQTTLESQRQVQVLPPPLPLLLTVGLSPLAPLRLQPLRPHHHCCSCCTVASTVLTASAIRQ